MRQGGTRRSQGLGPPSAASRRCDSGRATRAPWSQWSRRWRVESRVSACSSGSGDGSAARVCTLGWKMVTEPEAAPALKHSFFAGRTQARSRSNVLSVDEASSPRECSRHTSERTPASSRSSVWSVMGLSPPAGACGGTWAPTTTSVPTCVPTARRHLRPR